MQRDLGGFNMIDFSIGDLLWFRSIKWPEIATSSKKLVILDMEIYIFLKHNAAKKKHAE